MRIHRHIRSYRPDVKLLAWILTIEQHAAFDHLRSRKSRAIDNEKLRHEPETVSPLLQSSAEGATTVPEELEAALQDLSPEDRALIDERFLHGRSFAEMAPQTNLSEAAIRQRLSTVIRSVRKIVRP